MITLRKEVWTKTPPHLIFNAYPVPGLNPIEIMKDTNLRFQRYGFREREGDPDIALHEPRHFILGLLGVALYDATKEVEFMFGDVSSQKINLQEIQVTKEIIEQPTEIVEWMKLSLARGLVRYPVLANPEFGLLGTNQFRDIPLTGDMPFTCSQYEVHQDQNKVLTAMEEILFDDERALKFVSGLIETIRYKTPEESTVEAIRFLEDQVIEIANVIYEEQGRHLRFEKAEVALEIYDTSDPRIEKLLKIEEVAEMTDLQHTLIEAHRRLIEERSLEPRVAEALSTVQRFSSRALFYIGQWDITDIARYFQVDYWTIAGHLNEDQVGDDPIDEIDIDEYRGAMLAHVRKRLDRNLSKEESHPPKNSRLQRALSKLANLIFSRN